MTGRPSSFTQKIAETICTRLSEGESLRRICRDEAMPAKSMVMRWLEENEPFRDQYARARDLQADDFHARVTDIGLATLQKRYDPQAARVAIDALKWSAGKLAPRKYGDSVQLKHADAEGGRLPPNETEMTARVAAILALAEQRKADAG